MIKPKVHPTIIFRVPRFSYDEAIKDNWNELKECIKVSSPDFYTIIKDMTFSDLVMSEHKIQLTARKYYNRTAFRSTPYGLFATVGITTLNWNHTSGIQLEDKLHVHAYNEWQNKPTKFPSISEMSKENVLFFTNSTFYLVENEIRFIQKLGSDYEIAAIETDPVIVQILNRCTDKKTFNQISQEIGNTDDACLQEYLQDLINLQLLFTSLHPNIIGEDYFSRTDQTQIVEEKNYLISERKSRAGGHLDQKSFKHLPGLALKMQEILETDDTKDLIDFRDRFIQKFEQAEIPLMVAIDPEIGVGYGDYAIHRNSAVLAELLEGREKPVELVGSSKLIENLYRLIIQKNNNGGNIDLDELISQRQPTKTHVLPNSFHAICTLVDDFIHLESFGGVSATTLFGRFALAIEDVHIHCNEIAEIEQHSNPGVLLFDVGYTKEDSVDNINRRPSIYPLQLNILNYDTSMSPLCIHDILISVQKGLVVLRSKSLDKRLVPRFSSAYNHRRSDLPLFRLFMDVQMQGLQNSLMLKPSILIPGLPYYPRIEFKNIIVAPATWLLERSLIKDISNWKERCSVLRKHLEDTLSCNYVKTGVGDQTLLLDTCSGNDIEIILSILERVEHLYLEEAYLPKKSAVVDNKGKPFLPQIIVTLTHPTEILQPFHTSIKETPAIEKKQWVSPGGEWLYFEIYCSPFRTDALLHEKITGYLNTNKHLIHSWFFIRYNENGDHIRLRLKLNDAKNGYSLIGQLSDVLSNELMTGVVSDIKLCTYKKEVHRYSQFLIEKVERHFYKDSQFVLKMISAMLPDFAKYNLCIGTMDTIHKSNVIDDQSYNEIVERVAEALKIEHSLGRAELKKINVLFKEFQANKPFVLNKRSLLLYESLNDSFIAVLSECPKANRPKLFADLIHMHVNRLFVTDQRTHELVIYNFHLAMNKQNQHKNIRYSASL